MKVYISSSHTEGEDTQGVAELSRAVRAAGLKDFCFARDASGGRKSSLNPRELWSKVNDEIAACDALLIDVSGHPTSGRLVEMGIAYALKKPVIVVEKQGTHHKELFYGVSSEIIKYHDYEDLAHRLKKFEQDRSFNVTDKSTLFAISLLPGGILAWLSAQVYIPLALIVAVAYWLVVRQLVAPLRAFDRIVIYIPLAVVWLAVYYLLQSMYLPLALAWLVAFWVITVPLLQKLKFSL